MKRVIITILIAVSLTNLKAQEFTGVHTSPYLPFVGMINQPAELVRDSAKWNIHLLSAQAGILSGQSFADNDFWGTLEKFGFHDLKYFLGSEESLLYLKARFILPSITYKLNERHSFGLSTSVRADGVYNSSNDDFIKLFKGISNPEGLEDIKDEYFRSLVNGWVEYNAAWSTVLYKDDHHLLTGGIVLKFLHGLGAGYLQLEDVDVMFDKEHIAHLDMKMSYGFNESLGKTIDGGDIIEQSGDFGIGTDIGLSYSHVTDEQKMRGMPYKYKVGVVLADFGSIKHSKTKRQASYFVSMDDVPYSRFEGIQTLEALKDSIEKSIDIEKNTGGSFKTRLPLTLAANIDYCIKPNWFVNGTVVHSPNYYTSTVRLITRSVWRSNVTVRYETKDWGAFLPITHSNVLGWSMGLAGRYRNFFIGSSSLLSSLMKTGSGQDIVYFGVHIPIKE